MTPNNFLPLEPATYAPYKNRWIALARRRIIGVGEDAATAWQAAKSTAPKERPRLYFVDDQGVAHPQPAEFTIWFAHDLLSRVAHIWREGGQQAYLVGGAVRDGLLGRLPPDADLDLLVPAKALVVSRALADTLGAAYYPLDAKRQVGRVVLADQRHLDVAGFRGPSLAADLADRDFTVNAIALDLNPDAPKIFDPLGGQEDLRRKIIRVAGKEAIQHDPVRAMRAVRLAAELGFSIEPETQAQITAAGPALVNISAERLRDELVKLWQVGRPGQALTALARIGLLPHLLPEAQAMIGVAQSYPHYQPVFEHTLAVMDNLAALADLGDARIDFLEPVRMPLREYLDRQLAGNLSRRQLLPAAALWHDTGKPASAKLGSDGRIRFWQHQQISFELARQAMSRYRFSGQAIAFVSTVVKHHMRPLLLAHQPDVTGRAVHRFLVDTGDCAPAIALFALADHLGTYRPGEGQAEWDKLTAVALKLCEAYFAPAVPVLLTGRDIMERLSVSPGPRVGELLRRLREAQAIGQVSTPEEAVAYLQRINDKP